MPASTLSCRTASRAGTRASDSAEAQSKGSPSRTASASSSSGWFSPSTGHLFGQTHHSALGRLVRGARRRLPEHTGELLVGIAQLYSENDRFPFFRAKPRQSVLVALDFFHPDCFLEL